MDERVKTQPVHTNKGGVVINISYSSLFWLFLFGSIAGYFLEGFWNILRKGEWERHSATVYGPFCIIYGFGAVAIYLLSVYMRGKNMLFQFVVYCVTGTVLEYICCVFEEVVFSARTWNYSKQRLNIGGKISVLMTVIWGLLGLTLMHVVFPLLDRLLARMTGKFWNLACLILTVIVVADLAFSAAALMRWKERVTANLPPRNSVERFLDKSYGDEAMQEYYPNMKFFTKES